MFEHIFHPDRAISEVARTLKPGGAFISTVPMVMGSKPSRRRAELIEGEVRHHLPPEYHGNPVSGDGALVTVDWGYDLIPYLAAHSGLSMVLFNVQDADKGILGSLAEVVVGIKAGPARI